MEIERLHSKFSYLLDTESSSRLIVVNNLFINSRRNENTDDTTSNQIKNHVHNTHFFRL